MEEQLYGTQRGGGMDFSYSKIRWKREGKRRDEHRAGMTSCEYRTEKTHTRHGESVINRWCDGALYKPMEHAPRGTRKTELG